MDHGEICITLFSCAATSGSVAISTHTSPTVHVGCVCECGCVRLVRCLFEFIDLAEFPGGARYGSHALLVSFMGAGS